MIASSLMLAALLLQTPQSTAPTPKPAEAPVTAVAKMVAVEDDTPLEQRLLKVKRIYVESFGDDAVSKQIQAFIVSSLTETKRFVVTENKERADAVLKGAGLEKTSQEVHAYNDSTAAGGAAGGHSASWGTSGGSASGGFASRAAAISDSSLNTETIDHASIGVRLIDRDGDVIWTTSQESKGAKYKGASADVAEKVVKQLIRDLEKAEKKPAPSAPAK